MVDPTFLNHLNKLAHSSFCNHFYLHHLLFSTRLLQPRLEMACTLTLSQPIQAFNTAVGQEKIEQITHRPKLASDTEGWPMHLSSAAVWDGASLDESQYTYQLNKDEINELETALAHFKCIIPSDHGYRVLNIR
jgi:hypothetical protein